MVSPLMVELLNREHLDDLRREAAAEHLADEATRAHLGTPCRWPTIRWSFGFGRPGFGRLSAQRRNVAL
jgi:hypothetical protein